MSTLLVEEMSTIKLQPERRKYPRNKIAVQVELRLEDAPAPTHTQTSDLSLGGCYVEMSFTLAVGSKVDMALWLGDDKVLAKGVVITQHSYFGNGFQFVNLAPADQSKLARFLGSLSSSRH